MTDINSDKRKEEDSIMKTHIPGFDELFAEGGIPKRNSVLIAGGTGSGDVTKMYTVSLAEGLFKAGYTINPELHLAYTKYLHEADRIVRTRHVEDDGSVLSHFGAQSSV